MWPMPIVAVEPVEQLGRSLIRVLIGAGVGPFAKRGLNEAFGFSVGLRGVRPGEDLTKAKGVYSLPGTSLNGSTNHCPSSRVRRGCQAWQNRQQQLPGRQQHSLCAGWP